MRTLDRLYLECVKTERDIENEKRIEELEAQADSDVDIIKRQTKLIVALRKRLESVEGIGYNTHPSWGCSEEFNDGWKACREQIDDCIKEAALEKSDE